MEMPAAYTVICRKIAVFARIWHKIRNFLHPLLSVAAEYRCSYKTAHIDKETAYLVPLIKKVIIKEEKQTI